MTIPYKQERFIDEKQASEITGMSEAWFQKMRWSGGGIPYIKVGRSVRYRESDVLSYFEAHRVSQANNADLEYRSSK